MLRLDNVTKTYGRQTAVAGLSFSLQPGEVVGFLGPNGAGKSSTLKMICGYLQPDSGRIEVAGMNATHRPPEARRRIGYLPEHNPLYLDLYVREALRYAARLAGVPASQVRQRVADAIDRTGLGPEAHKPLSALSKGYRQRAGIAQALLHDPDLIILDEPTSGLDPNQVLDIRQLIRDLGQTKAVLFSSHILQEVEAVASRVLILHRGQLRYDGPLQMQIGTPMLEVEFAREGFDFAALEADGKLLQRTGSGRHWQLQLAPDTDLRPLLVAESVRQDNALLSLTQPEANLAQLFRRLTQD